jgi:hypothetical protein
MEGDCASILAWTEKCKAKEASRQKALTSQRPLVCADFNHTEVAALKKTKQAAVNTIVKPVQRKGTMDSGEDTNLLVDATKTRKRVKRRKPHSKASVPTSPMVLQDITNTPKEPLKTTIHFCGCRHGDLGALRSFTKAERSYYTRPTKFLEGRGCLDCQKAVIELKPVASSQPVVYYCDEGIKGFNAPNDDPMKSALTCDLVICAQCEATRRKTFEIGSSGRPGSSRKRCRR